MKKRIHVKNALPLLITVITLIFSSCELNAVKTVEVENTPQYAPYGSPTVYTAGYFNDGSVTNACFWKGTRRTKLNGQLANDIYIDPQYGIVLVAGAFNENGQMRPCYWKYNSSYRMDLPCSERSGIANGIYHSGDIYTSGNGGNSQPCYWMHSNARVNLSGSKTSDIFAYNNKPYTSGWYYSGNQTKACYWAGSKRITLPSPSDYNSYASSVYVYNGTVYTAGWYYNSDKALSVACYWVGTRRVDLSGSVASGIFVYKGKVYVSGNYKSGSVYRACSWTNKSRTNLPSSYGGYANGIFVSLNGR